MPVAKPDSSGSRIIAHVDMDCFYVQVEQRKQPSLRGRPTAVVQYNSWKGGGLIAVSYEARKSGVKRSMRGDEAKEVCPQIQLVQVPVARGKADLSIYRNAGSEVISILAKKGRCERASIDEVYLDLTVAAETLLAETPPESLEAIDEEVLKSNVLGLDVGRSDVKDSVREWLCRSDADRRDKLLACGALIVAALRLQVLKETEFTCSAGVAHNKMLAKLASGLNKPAQQTVVPFSSVERLLESLPIKKMKQLGGKLGSTLQIDLGVKTVGDLLRFPEEKLQECYGINTGTWLWNIARGISGEEVESRLLPKSHGSGKTFPGRQALKTIASVEHWLNGLCEELSERLHSDLEQNKRIARTLTLHSRAYKPDDSESHKNFPSKSCPLRYGTGKIQEDALNLFLGGLREYLGSYRIKSQGNQSNGWGITALSVSASKIVATPSGTCSIMKYFNNQEQSYSLSKHLDDNIIQEVTLLSPLGSECYLGLHPSKPNKEFCEEETNIKCTMLSWNRQEDEKMMCKDEETCGNMRPALERGLSFSASNQAQAGFIQPVSVLSLSGALVHLGAESCLVTKQTEQLVNSPGEKTGVKYFMPAVKIRKQTRKSLKQKGNTSILRFFQGHSSCSTHKQERVKIIQETKSCSSSGFLSSCNSCLGPIKAEVPQESLDRNGLRGNAWNYKTNEIDPTVFSELPPEIQEEVKAWLRPQKRANSVEKRGSSISHYFLPTKNT